MSVTSKKTDDSLIVSFKNTHNSIVNSIRRTILDDIPTFAIEDVEIVVNESPLYDETIAHRLGLIPLQTDLKSYNFRDSCKCGGIGCALCEVKMSLKQEEDGYVLSKELKSDDPKIVPSDNEIPITKLFMGKKIELNTKAILGCGRVHAKWSPAHTYLKESGKNLDLIIEPFGQLDAKTIYNKSIEILTKKIDDLGGEL